jgi:adenosylcobyric acid synthase
MEDTTVRFVTDPKDIAGSDAIIIPGTKNTIDDLIWMKETGMDRAVKEMKGKIPILGICGGYQIMGKLLKDPQGIEGKIPQTLDGLGFFDMETEWNEYKKKVIQDYGYLIETKEPVVGYEIHMGLSEIKEEPLFVIERFKENETEGSVRISELLFGTYLHGVFDKPAFRKYFLSFVKHNGTAVVATETRDYDDLIEENIEKLAQVFEEGLDMERFMDIVEAGR